MARRRGQRKGYLVKCGPSWIGQWREDFRDEDGSITRRKVAATIAPAKGPGAVSKRQAQRIFWDTVLSKLDTFSTRPQTMATLAEFIRLNYEPECLAMRRDPRALPWAVFYGNTYCPRWDRSACGTSGRTT